MSASTPRAGAAVSAFDPRSAPLVVMAKAPVLGRVKTRLAPHLGAEGAAAFCAAMTADVLALAAAAGPARVALEGDPSSSWARALPLPVEPQAEGDLTARLRRALRDGGLAIGTDAPTLPATLLAEARAALARHDVVFAPAFDGGYVLAGVRPNALAVFDDVPWSATDTFAASVERARALRLSTATLGFWYDIDTPGDLAFLRAHLRALPPGTAPSTRAFLQDLPDAPPLR